MSIPYDGADWVVFEGGIPSSVLTGLTPFAFDMSSVGANNANTNTVKRAALSTF
jgi:hypothetical protein